MASPLVNAFAPQVGKAGDFLRMCPALPLLRPDVSAKLGLIEGFDVESTRVGWSSNGPNKLS